MDQRTMRNIFGQFATGVTVITCANNDGAAHGATVTAFTPISIEPRLCQVTLTRKSKACGYLDDAPFAVNILKSVSRTMPRAADPEFLPVITRAKQIMATYADMEELIRLGAYRPGSSPEVDEAIRLHGPLEAFLGQRKDEATTLSEGYQQLASILTVLETEK